MPRYRLTVALVRSAGPGKHEDGGGLRLLRREDGSGSWVLRFSLHGRRREMGLGSAYDLTLAQARAEADRWRAFAMAGGDPILERDRLRREARGSDTSLRSVALDCFQSRKRSLKGDGEAGGWFTPLALHILPRLGKVPVVDLDQRLLRDCLAPIWHTKPAAAAVAATRLSIVVQHAAALGIDVDLQVVDKARALLGAHGAVATHVPAMPWTEVPAFYAGLGGGVTHLALRLLILTASRGTPVRLMDPAEVDAASAVWSIAGEKMKGRRGRTPDFRIPLSTEAQAVVAEAMPLARGSLLFPGRSGNAPLSPLTFSRAMERMGLAGRPHGFRSSFRDWCSETGVARDLAEMSLGHQVGGKVERAYARSDLLEQRRAVMEAWSAHVTGGRS